MARCAELIAVGTELLLGSIANTDGQEISRELAAMGINVYYHTVVGDNPERLRAVVETAKSRADLIITTGGLGPTCDDLTKNILAQAFGRKLVFHAPSAARIEDYFARLHPARKMTENNLQQAMLPEGCDVLANDWGTAPGCAWTQDGITVVMLPGPPRECSAMLRHRVIPYLAALGEGEIVSRTLCLFGIGESAMEARVRDKMLAMSNPTLAPYAKEGSTELRITAKAPTREACLALIDPVEAQLRAEFGDYIYGVDVKTPAQQACRLLLEKNVTLASAESCTGGMVAARCTDEAGVSAVFRGGIVCYSNEVKRDTLCISEQTLAQYGAVSPQVCRLMAQQVRALLGADLGVSVTGVAGPTEDDRGNPVGLIYVGLADAQRTWVRTLHLGGGRGRNRNMASHHAFDMIRRYLTDLNPVPQEYEQ